MNPRPTILLVDDEPSALDLLGAALERENVEASYVLKSRIRNQESGINCIHARLRRLATKPREKCTLVCCNR